MGGLSTPFLTAFILAILFVIRMIAIFVSPLDLGVDEAQYWLWGQTPQLGYYSKPPLIAWLLSGSDWLLGSSAAAVRSLSAVLHLVTAALLWIAAGALFDARTGRLTALVWASLPAVGLGSFIMSTDSVMLVFWSAALACLCVAQSYPDRLYRYSAAAGAFIGMASLGKYAGLYFLAGFAGWLLFSCEWRTKTRLMAFLVFTCCTAIFASPTIIFNLSNDFVTVAHVGDNADLDRAQLSVMNLLHFLGAQFFVFGPLAFLLLLGGFVSAPSKDRQKFTLLRWFALPVLGVICLQAVLREANANWAVAAFPAGTILVARLLLDRYARTKRLAGVTLSVNFILSGAITICLGMGSLGILTPKSDPLRRLRGWEALAQDAQAVMSQTGARTLVAHHRAEAALMQWHFREMRDRFSITINLQAGSDASLAGNHYARSYPVAEDTPRPLLVMTGTAERPPAFLANPRGPVATSSTPISAAKNRTIDFWVVE